MGAGPRNGLMLARPPARHSVLLALCPLAANQQLARHFMPRPRRSVQHKLESASVPSTCEHTQWATFSDAPASLRLDPLLWNSHTMRTGGRTLRRLCAEPAGLASMYSVWWLYRLVYQFIALKSQKK